MAKLDLGLPSYDSLFSTEEERQEANLEKIVSIPIDKISDFKDHPFHVTMDEDMLKLIDSIKENGILIPALVRPKADGTYEMISGHRRKYAMSHIGLKEMKVIIRDLDDDQATILMVDSNIQRENIYPSERGYAYKMRLEAMVHQGKKVDINTDNITIKYDKTSRQVGTKLSLSIQHGCHRITLVEFFLEVSLPPDAFYRHILFRMGRCFHAGYWSPPSGWLPDHHPGHGQ